MVLLYYKNLLESKKTLNKVQAVLEELFNYYTSTISVCVWLSVAGIKTDCNVKKWANVLKFNPIVWEKDQKQFHALFSL